MPENPMPENLSSEINFPGLTEEQLQYLFDVMTHGVSACCAADQKQRHAILMVLTRDSVDHASGDPIVTTDLISTLTREEAHIAMRDWLHRSTQ